MEYLYNTILCSYYKEQDRSVCTHRERYPDIMFNGKKQVTKKYLKCNLIYEKNNPVCVDI